jgi:hypothetical protein
MEFPDHNGRVIPILVISIISGVLLQSTRHRTEEHDQIRLGLRDK